MRLELGWKDPRLYPRSLDPLEFALSILNKPEGNDARDGGLPGFAKLRPLLLEHLRRIAEEGPEARPPLELSEGTQIPIHGLELVKTENGWAYEKSATERTAADHRLLTIVAIFYLLPRDGRRHRLRLCQHCARFFFHSQRRRNTGGHWCSVRCRERVKLSRRDKKRHAELERARREANSYRSQPEAIRDILRSLGK